MLYAFSYKLAKKRICLIALGHPILTADKFAPEVSSPHFFSAPNSVGNDSHVFTGLANFRNPHPSSPFFFSLGKALNANPGRD
jgi:hypothetical protein